MTLGEYLDQEECCLLAGGLIVMRLDSGNVLFWCRGSRFQIVPEVTESGERVTLDDLRDLDAALFLPIAEQMSEFPLDHA